MHEDFYRIYQTLVAGYGGRPFRPQWPGPFAPIPEIEKAIETAGLQANVSLRPDATFFLALNFGEMIARPRLLRGNVDAGDVRGAIEKDLGVILRAAKKATSETKEKEVDAGAVLQSVGRQWKDLAASRGWEE